mgnify:CR=1 FL=1
MPVATLESLRDRIIVLITALTPTSLTGDKFRGSLDESEADFRKAAEAAPAGCLRRFQVRNDGSDDLPAVSNADTAQLRAKLRILVAYPQTHRYGGSAGRDRDDVIDQDWRKINFSVGVYGRANFSTTHDCTPLGCRKEVEIGTSGVDYLVIAFEANYYLDVDA